MEKAYEERIAAEKEAEKAANANWASTARSDGQGNNPWATASAKIHEGWVATAEASKKAIDATAGAVQRVGPALNNFGKDFEKKVGPALEKAGSGLERSAKASAGATVNAWKHVSTGAQKTWQAVEKSNVREQTGVELKKGWRDFNKFVKGDWGDFQQDSLPPLKPPGDRCPLLGSRRFVTDACRISEQLAMDDMTTNYWPSEEELEADAERLGITDLHSTAVGKASEKPPASPQAAKGATNVETPPGSASGRAQSRQLEFEPVSALDSPAVAAPGTPEGDHERHDLHKHSSDVAQQVAAEFESFAATNSPAKAGSGASGEESEVQDLAEQVASAVNVDKMPSAANGNGKMSTWRRIETMHARLRCRERAAFFASDRIGELARRNDNDNPMHCEVRKRRAAWAVELQLRYDAKVLCWIDTGLGLEKQAAVIRLQPKGEEPIIFVTFRGSKKVEDFVLSDLSIVLAALPAPKFAPLIDEAWKEDKRPGRHVPHCTAGLWWAYAGEHKEVKKSHGGFTKVPHPFSGKRGYDPKAAKASKKVSEGADQVVKVQYLNGEAAEGGEAAAAAVDVTDDKKPPAAEPEPESSESAAAHDKEAGRARTREGSPRMLVRAAVEAALLAEPKARLFVSGHSLGGCLAMLCAYDLVTSSEIVHARGCSTISFGSPRFFDVHFIRAFASLERAGKLTALRVMIEDDMVPRLPPRALGMRSCCVGRVIIDVEDDERPMRYADDEAERDKMRGNNVVSHTSYSIYLGSEVTPGRPITLPPERVHIPHPKQGVVAETRPSELSRWPACSYQPWFQSRESYKASSKSSSDPA